MQFTLSDLIMHQSNGCDLPVVSPKEERGFQPPKNELISGCCPKTFSSSPPKKGVHVRCVRGDLGHRGGKSSGSVNGIRSFVFQVDLLLLELQLGQSCDPELQRTVWQGTGRVRMGQKRVCPRYVGGHHFRQPSMQVDMGAELGLRGGGGGGGPERRATKF